MIRIGIAEDQALIRESLAIVLGLDPQIEVCWTAETGNDAVTRIRSNPVDVVLMDLRMPEMDGVSAIRHIRRDASLEVMPIIIVLTTFHHDEWLVDALSAGAEACLLKEIPPRLLLRALREIASGVWNPSEWSNEWRKFVPDIQFKTRLGAKAEEDPSVGLTARDLDILRKLCAGATNGEIAATLHLTEGTVKNYVSSLYAKLGVRHRAEAVKIAHERGLN